jgi:hypothetical protein
VQIDIYSLGVVIAWLECNGLPSYVEGWKTHPTAWVHAVRDHVTRHAKIQNNKLLDLILDDMLVEDPDERSSADYCHDEARRLLEARKLLDDITNPHCQESDEYDSDGGSITPKPVTLAAQSSHIEFLTLSSLDAEEPPQPGILTPTWYSSRSAKRQRTENRSTDYGYHVKCPDHERHSGSRPDGDVPSFISEWGEGSHLRPFNQSECLNLPAHDSVGTEDLIETAGMLANTRNPTDNISFSKTAKTVTIMESLLQSSVESDNHHDVLPLPPELPDSDLFALLYPDNIFATVAIQQSCNATRYVAPPAEEDVDSQESTPAPALRPFLNNGYLALRFSDTDKGYWTLGSNNSCDVILQGQGISNHHCEIICDTDLSFKLRDMSTYGTGFLYNGGDLEFNKNCDWLIARYREPLLWTMLFRIGNMDFHILVPNHHRLDEEYLGKIRGFQEARLSGLSALSSLGVQSLTTTIEPGTPVESSIPVLPEPENIVAVSESIIRTMEECLSARLESVGRDDTRGLLAEWIRNLLPNRKQSFGAYGERQAKNEAFCPWWPSTIPYIKPASLSKHGKPGNFPFSQVLTLMSSEIVQVGSRLLVYYAQTTITAIKSRAKWTAKLQEWSQPLELLEALQHKLLNGTTALVDIRHSADTEPTIQEDSKIVASDYVEVQTSPTSVFIRTQDHWVNATQVLKAAGIDRRKLRDLRANKNLITNYDIVDRGSKKTQGTYVCLSEGLGLCNEYKLVGLREMLTVWVLKK